MTLFSCSLCLDTVSFLDSDMLAVNLQFYLLQLHLAPSWGAFNWNFSKIFVQGKATAERRMLVTLVASVDLTQYQTDVTDGQTDEVTYGIAITVPRYAQLCSVRGENSVSHINLAFI